MKFRQLSEILKITNESLYSNAVKAVNINLTLRNWIFGFYIVEFEQNGEDRAVYGQKLLQNLADTLCIEGLSVTGLTRCRQFYKIYPQILGLLTQKFNTLLPNEILGTLSQKSELQIRATPSHESLNYEQIGATPSHQFQDTDNKYFIKILTSISFSHFTELIKIEDNTKRMFYEMLILKTTPSVKELKRQIETLTYERFGLSTDYTTALKQIEQKISPESSTDVVKSHYFFEFLKIKQPQQIEETELEQALINHLQDFIIELGNGFCFEARQKRVLIGDEYFFIDLVFYHRLLKCHVLIELKTEKAKYEHIGQLKVYLQHYKKTIMAPDDNPPVGILLVTDKNETLVEYAIAEADKELFVSKYQLQLPDKKKLQDFIQNELKILNL